MSSDYKVIVAADTLSMADAATGKLIANMARISAGMMATESVADCRF